MSDAEKRQFKTALLALGVTFGVPVDKPLLAAYWQFLRGLDLQAFGVAVEAAGRTLKWFPKPAELLDLAGAGATARKAAAAEAWEAVCVAMGRYDYTMSVDFGPLVNAVIRNLGGWQALCGKSLRELVWERKKFEEVFELFGTSRAQLRGEPLQGRFGGEPARIAIGGQVPQRQLGDGGGTVLPIVRALAEGSGGGGR